MDELLLTGVVKHYLKAHLLLIWPCMQLFVETRYSFVAPLKIYIIMPFHDIILYYLSKYSSI